MIEIFTRGTATDSQSVRSTGNTVLLKEPADVYLGRASAGIAYYEKAGADLRVTLLDQQVVVFRNFFSMGPNGEFSRLLQNDGNTVEVTGLIAPEPFEARDEVPDVVAQPIEAPAAMSVEAPVQAESTQPATVYENTSNVTETSASTAAGGLFGVNYDLLAFGAANIAMLWTGLRDDDDSAVPDSPAMDPGVAAMLTSIESAPPAAVEESPAPVLGAAEAPEIVLASGGLPLGTDITIVTDYY